MPGQPSVGSQHGRQPVGEAAGAVADIGQLPQVLGTQRNRLAWSDAGGVQLPSVVDAAHPALFGRGSARACGQVIRDGSDKPRLGRARKIERLAQTFGVEPA